MTTACAATSIKFCGSCGTCTAASLQFMWMLRHLLHNLLNLLEQIVRKHYNSGLVIYAVLCHSSISEVFHSQLIDEAFILELLDNFVDSVFKFSIPFGEDYIHRPA